MTYPEVHITLDIDKRGDTDTPFRPAKNERPAVEFPIGIDPESSLAYADIYMDPDDLQRMLQNITDLWGDGADALYVKHNQDSLDMTGVILGYTLYEPDDGSQRIRIYTAVQTNETL